MPENQIKVRLANVDEHDRVIKTLTLGFAAEPLGRWLWPDASVYWDEGLAGWDAFVGKAIPAGTAYVTSDFTGVALWFAPNTHPGHEEFDVVLRRSVEAARLDDIYAVFNQMEAHYPQEPYWYLPTISVDPAYQNRGVGGALMTAALQRIDQEDGWAYLEASSLQSARLYERYDFDVTGEIQVGDSPLILPMVRKPK